MDIGLGVKGLIKRNDRVLVLFKPDGALDWPGGRVETGESFHLALFREALEETGLSIQILDVLAHWAFVKKNGLYISGLTFECRALGEQVFLSEEHRGFRWMNRGEILSHLPLQRFLEGRSGSCNGNS